MLTSNHNRTAKIISQDQFSKAFNSTSSKNIPKKIKKDSSKPDLDCQKFAFFDNCPQARRLYHKESVKKLNDDEQLIDMDIDLEGSRYSYANPIKPRYYSKVRAVYEWNKYNQTHYNIDNPPQKTIMGYEFHVFYPMLKDPSKTPQFKVQKTPQNSDKSTCILVFTSGEPYTDLAFRIVSDDWDTSAKHGFKCYFENGVLFLKFNIRRSYMHSGR